jgi:hypothetical protein
MEPSRARGLTDRLTQGTSSFAGRRRSSRWQKLRQAFPELEQMRVLDLGGRPNFWANSGVAPAQLICLNLEPRPAVGLPAWSSYVQGDACDPPDALRHERFDLVISNSVIEHVGGWHQRQRFAEVVHEYAPRHWIQTPYRYFPVEPHWLFPGMQFLPLWARTIVVKRWPYGYFHTSDPDAAIDLAMSVDLLSLTEMKVLFPGSELWRERFCGLVKSVVAITPGS